LTNFSRFDIAYVVDRLGKYTHNLDNSHWAVLERVFKYLKGTINYEIHYINFLSVIEGYSDENWIFDFDDTNSTTSYVFSLGGGAISWKSTKQSIFYDLPCNLLLRQNLLKIFYMIYDC